MNYATGSIFSGFLKGIAQAKQMQFVSEKDKEMNALKKQALQLELQNKKLAQGKLKLIEMLVAPALQKQQQDTAKQEAANVGDVGLGSSVEGTTPMAPSVTSRMADMSIPPEAMILLGGELGDLANFQQDEQRNQVLKDQGDKRLVLQAQGVEQRKRANDLAEARARTNIHVPGVGDVSVPTLDLGNNVLTKPSASGMPIPAGDLSLWVHPETLDSPQFGMTSGQAKEAGFRRISANDKSKVNDFKSVNVLAERIKNLMGEVFPQSEDFKGRITGGISRKFGAMTQTNNSAALLQSLLDGTQAAFVRMFEKGTLTDQDIARARKLNVSLTDDADVAWKKINGLIEFTQELQSRFVGGQSKGGEKIPASARKKLKEGIKTEFGNGQIWTLQNGEPVRLK